MADLSEHFSRVEFACRDGCGNDSIDVATLEVLEHLREHFAKPVTINSAYRCETHNAAVGGASDSQHLRGRAVDIAVDDVAPAAVADWLEMNYAGRFGVGRYNTFTHLDTRTDGPARWSG